MQNISLFIPFAILTSMSGSIEINKADESIPVYRKALYSLPKTFAPNLALSTSEHVLANLMYQGLFTVNEDLEIVPSLVETWQLDSTQTTYTMKIRQDIRFHDGSIVRTGDLVNTINRLRDDKNVALDLRRVERVSTNDDTTIVVKLSKPYPAFLALLAAPVASVYKESQDTAYPIGTGPFIYAGFERKSEKDVLVLRANEFLRPLPHIKKLEIWELTENEAIEGVNSGFIHDSTNYLLKSGQSYAGTVGKEISSPTASTWIISLNTSKPPLADLKVRKCLVDTFPKEKFVNTFLPDHRPAVGFLPPMLLGSSVDDWPKHSDLSDCLVQIDRSLVLDFPDLMQSGSEMCKLMQVSWKKIGVDLRCNGLAFANLLERIMNKTADLSFLSATLDLPDVDFYLSSFESGSRFNFSNYNSTTLDENLSSARLERDRLKRAQYYEAINRELFENSVTINISYPTHISYRHRCLENLTLGVGGEYYIDYSKVSLSKGCKRFNDFQ